MVKCVEWGFIVCVIERRIVRELVTG